MNQLIYEAKERNYELYRKAFYKTMQEFGDAAESVATFDKDVPNGYGYDYLYQNIYHIHPQHVTLDFRYFDGDVTLDLTGSINAINEAKPIILGRFEKNLKEILER